MLKSFLLGAAIGLAATAVCAQPISPPVSPAEPARGHGTLVQMVGQAEIEVPNDEAVASFYAEVQDADLARAQSQVNQRVADATAALKKADPKARLESAGYSSYPVYGRDGGRRITGWRVRQSLNLRTADLTGLPRAVAAAQQQLALGGIAFRLSPEARQRVEAQLIQQAVASFNARLAAAAQALAAPMTRVRIEELNFGVAPGEPAPMLDMARARVLAADAVTEPSFEAGSSVLRQVVTGRARVLPAP
jgi:predicted secreted protein